MAKPAKIAAALLIALAPLPVRANDALVVHISCTNATAQTSIGSGVLVSAQGHVLTAKHVAPQGYNCTGAIGGLTAPQHPLTQPKRSPDADIMTLKFDHPSTQNLEFASYCPLNETMKRRKIHTYGFHALKQNEPPVTDGIISTYILDERGMFETTAQTVQGKSGGPVFLENTTALMGVVSEVRFTSISEPIAYYVTPAETMLDILELSPSENCAPVVNKYDLDTHKELLDERFAELLDQINSGNSGELALLRQQLAEVERQKADLQASFEAREEDLRILRLQLAELGNSQIASEKLEAAQEALYQGDTSLADEIFKEIEEAEEAGIKRAAAAAFGRGKIAEDEIRWKDAARHYAKAARLEPTYDHLYSATGLAWKMGYYENALIMSDQLLFLASEEFGSETQRYAAALNYSALLHQDLGRYDEAEPLHREAIRIDEITIGKEHPDYAIRLNNLAGLLRTTGRYDEAEPLYREAMRITETTMGKEHAAYATRLNNLALLLETTDRHEEAEPLYREAIAIFKASLGDDHPNTRIVQGNLDLLLSDMSKNP